RAVVVLARARPGPGRIPLGEERGAVAFHLRMLVRRLRRRFDELAVFRTGNVPDGGFVKRRDQRRRERHQGKRSTQPANEATMWAHIAQRDAFDAKGAGKYSARVQFAQLADIRT